MNKNITYDNKQIKKRLAMMKRST